MALKWNTVRPEHVRAACEVVAAARTRASTSGIVVWHNEQPLPAKEVLRNAYRLANNLRADEEVKFASGDATLRFLETLGFSAQRIGAKRTRKDETKSAPPEET
jgi:hypothetical protein